MLTTTTSPLLSAPFSAGLIGQEIQISTPPSTIQNSKFVKKAKKLIYTILKSQ